MTHQEHWMQTYLGYAVDLLDPQLEQIHVEDIAYHLAGVVRYTGAAKFRPTLFQALTAIPRYNVADHSIRVSRLTRNMEGLMHDASEAYLGDVSSPLKALLPDYRQIEKKFEAVLAEKFHLRHSPFLDNLVKQADLTLLATEVRDGMTRPPRPWLPMPPPLPDRIIPMSHDQAYREFLKRYRELDT